MRGDPEQLRVEEFDVAQVSAGAAALPQPRARADGVAAAAEQTPEALEVVGAGEAAGHADDGDRFKAFAFERRPSLHCTAQMRCEAFDGWIVECNGRRKRHAQQAAEIADQLHQLDGIEAQRRERLV